MKKKFLLLFVIIVLGFGIIACTKKSNSSQNGLANTESSSHEYQYGILLNIPDSWDEKSYEVNVIEDNEYTKMLVSENNEALYGLKFDYVDETSANRLFDIYVFNTVDWNDICLSIGDRIPLGTEIKTNKNLSYVLANRPHENPFDLSSEEGIEFAEMELYITDYEENNFFTILESSDFPTKYESEEETVAAYFDNGITLNIPTRWDRNNIEFDYAYYVPVEDATADYQLVYNYKSSDGDFELFKIYVFPSLEYPSIPFGVRVSGNMDTSYVLVLPESNPFESGSDDWKKFSQMQDNIRDINSFFKFPY